MRTYTGHHTCSKENGEEYVVNNSPFRSKITDTSIPFLGVGYYFWDFDINQAKKWGKDHYNSQYFVIEADINTNDTNFLDLVGDRKHMDYIVKMASRFASNGLKFNEWKLAKLIEFLKKVNKSNPTVFPFEVIRAQDYNVFLEPNYKFFFKDSYSFTYLNPRHIFCLILKNDIILSNKKIIFRS